MQAFTNPLYSNTFVFTNIMNTSDISFSRCIVAVYVKRIDIDLLDVLVKSIR